MKYITRVASIVLCCAALTYAATNPKKEGVLPDFAKSADAMTAQLTNPTEQALHAVRIPELNFAQANCFDCIEFVQNSIAKHAPKNAKLRPNIAIDLTALRYLLADAEAKDGPPLLTYGARNISALQAIRLIEAATELRFVMKDNLVIVEKKTANK